jgi:hypothetical protein
VTQMIAAIFRLAGDAGFATEGNSTTTSACR